ncbi:MAG: type IV toxin-antitoxin system AbiEi family antitoxin domain-containing protein [Actinomycetaceae bacterium]|nr:type IV toxin-antitoxin system AbiEi family antitoxin domain-containing protein [Actinomycetaceae bacterium]
MSHLAETIVSAARALPEGGLLSAKDFLHLGTRAAVDQTLSRLTREGKLMRVGRGAYAAPMLSRFGARPPSTEAVLKSLESTRGETIVASGATEANALGLSTQVPTREIFLTTGRPRTFQLGNRTVEIRRGNRWQMVLGARLSGKAIRALSWLGPERAPSALKALHTRLPPEEWAALRSARSVMPSWMARAISEASEHA